MTWRALVVAFAVASALMPATAAAQLDAEFGRRYEILGFGGGGERYAVRVEVAGSPPVLEVRDTLTGARQAELPAPNQKAAERAERVLRRRHGIRDPVVGQASPDGRTTLLGAPSRDGRLYRLLVMDGARIGELERVELTRDKRTRAQATAMLKQVAWSKDGKWLVAVLTERFVSSRQAWEVDRVVPLRFRRWKVRWIREEPKGSP